MPEFINVTKAELPPLTDYIKYLKRIWAKSWLTNNGEYVQLLEKRLKKFLRVRNILVVANGTIAAPIRPAFKRPIPKSKDASSPANGLIANAASDAP